MLYILCCDLSVAVVTVMFGRPEASFNESEGMYSMCIVKDRVTARRVSVTILDTSGTAIRNTGKTMTHMCEKNLIGI